MRIWKKFFLFTFALFFSNYIFAKNIVFSCIQNTEAPENARNITLVLEDYVFDLLFDYGLIASNVPLTSNTVSLIENVNAVCNALENDSDYILIINATYAEEVFIDKMTGSKTAALEKLKYSLFSLEKNKFIYTASAKISKSKTKKDLVKKLEKANTAIMKNLIHKIKK